MGSAGSKWEGPERQKGRGEWRSQKALGTAKQPETWISTGSPFLLDTFPVGDVCPS